MLEVEPRAALDQTPHHRPAAQVVGIALNTVFNYAPERVAFGNPIIEQQTVGIRSLPWPASRQPDNLCCTPLNCAIVDHVSRKPERPNWSSETAEVCSEAIQTFGGCG